MSLLSTAFTALVFGIIVDQITAEYLSTNDIQDQTYGKVALFLIKST